MAEKICFMGDFEKDLRKEIYNLVEKIKENKDIGESLHTGRKPDKLEASAFMACYNQALEALGLFKFYNSQFPGDDSISDHQNILKEIIESNRAYIERRLNH